MITIPLSVFGLMTVREVAAYHPSHDGRIRLTLSDSGQAASGCERTLTGGCLAALHGASVSPDALLGPLASASVRLVHERSFTSRDEPRRFGAR
jgi:hypothetical protein